MGIIRKVIGLDGACGVQAYGATLRQLTLPATVFVGSSEMQCRRITLERVEFRPKGPACHFFDVATPEAAEALRGQLLFIDDALLPPLDDSSFYHFELVGMKVRTDRGDDIGTVKAVHNHPSVDSIEIERYDKGTLMAPLTREALLAIDKMSGYLTLSYSFIDELL